MLALLLAACDPSSSQEDASAGDSAVCDAPVVELTDVGQACVLGNYDGTVTLQVSLAAYGGCMTAPGFGCTATLDGERIEVTAWIELQESCEPVCPLDLEAAIATCELPALGEGPYTLDYAGSETTFGIPVEGGYTCIGENPPTY